MDYEKKYKEARSRAKELISRCKNNRDYKTMIYRAEDIVSIFPELRESEGERIKKVLIDYFNRHNVAINLLYGIKIDEVISWLEKQGEQKTNIPKWKYKKDDMPLLKDSIILNKYGCVVKSPSGAMVSDAWVLDYDELTKLPKEEKVDNANKVEPKDYNSIDPYFAKSIDKVKPKFHEGDWVVQGDNILKIRCAGRTHYCFETVGGYVDDVLVSEIDSQFHLWSIEDAKDGDVLCGFPKDDYPWLGIFCKLNNKDNFDSYCYLQAGRTGKFCPPNEKNIFGRRNVDNHSSYDVFPATKEQRDKLLKAMSDAGYTFDFEKKELKKKSQS